MKVRWQKRRKHQTVHPRRKKYSQSARLQNAKKWAEQYHGKNLAKGYSNWFGVDLISAITELEMIGYTFKQSYKDQVKKSLIERQKPKEKRKREREKEQEMNENGFYYIDGYTSNGFPYGITFDEMDEKLLNNLNI